MGDLEQIGLSPSLAARRARSGRSQGHPPPAEGEPDLWEALGHGTRKPLSSIMAVKTVVVSNAGVAAINGVLWPWAVRLSFLEICSI